MIYLELLLCVNIREFETSMKLLHHRELLVRFIVSCKLLPQAN